MGRRIGLIGCGNMGTAILHGILAARLAEPGDVWASARTQATLDRLQKEYGINTTGDNRKVVQQCDTVFLCVVPDLFDQVLKEIKDVALADQVFISVAAGVSIARMKKILGRDKKIIRTMPNTPALVGEGTTVLAVEPPVTEEELNAALTLFNSVGKTAVLEEGLIDASVALTATSNGYVYLMIEAMADGAVKWGIPRQQAYALAAQAVLGAAKMVRDTGKHPAVLKDEICTPGGTTIEALAVLEKLGFRSAIIQAMNACTEKALRLGRQNDAAETDQPGQELA